MLAKQIIKAQWNKVETKPMLRALEKKEFQFMQKPVKVSFHWCQKQHPYVVREHSKRATYHLTVNRP